jgi:tetratricopeptide (TPR) repeat protein
VAFSQIGLGVIQGVVTDEAGTPLDDVTFRIRDTGRGREFTIKSDKSGRFYRRGLPAVDYEITVEKEGYQPIHDKVRLNAGVDRRFSFKLVRAAPEGAEEFAQGVEAFRRGDHAAAATAFEAAVEKAPDLPEVRVNLAMAYLRLQRTADAVAQIEKAATLAPHMPGVLFQLGGVYVETNDLDKAAAAFEKGLAKQPDLNDALAYDATVTLGAVYFAKGQNEQAATQFEKALAARPGAAAPSLGLAKVHFSKGEVDKALALFDRIVAQHPGTPEAAQAATFIKELRKGAGQAAPSVSLLRSDVHAELDNKGVPP